MAAATERQGTHRERRETSSPPPPSQRCALKHFSDFGGGGKKKKRKKSCSRDGFGAGAGAPPAGHAGNCARDGEVVPLRPTCRPASQRLGAQALQMLKNKTPKPQRPPPLWGQGSTVGGAPRGLEASARFMGEGACAAGPARLWGGRGGRSASDPPSTRLCHSPPAPPPPTALVTPTGAPAHRPCVSIRISLTPGRPLVLEREGRSESWRRE